MHSRVVAPVDALPNEILTIIFTEIRKFNLNHMRETYSRKNAAFSQVSRHWRDVTLTSPSLWAEINIDQRLKVKFLKLLLQRSREHGIDIHVSYSICSPFPNPMDRDLIDRTCDAHYSTCQYGGENSASYHLDSLQDINKVLVPIRHSCAPLLLQKLTIDRRQGSRYDFAPPEILTGGAPVLSRVETEGISSHVIFYLRCPPSAVLRLKWTFHSMSYENFRQLLTACHSLRGLHFDGTVTSLPPPDQRPPPLVLLSLEALGFWCGLDTLVTQTEFGTMLRTPALEILRLWPVDPFQLQAFLHPIGESPQVSSYSLLKSLRLRRGSVTEAVIIEFTNTCPLINHFSLEECEF